VKQQPAGLQGKLTSITAGQQQARVYRLYLARTEAAALFWYFFQEGRVNRPFDLLFSVYTKWSSVVKKAKKAREN